MDIGKYGVFIGLGASITAILLYVLSLRGNRRVLLAARSAFAVTALSVFFCFGRLMFLVSHHRFEFDYVFRFSSADLGFPWKYAATWAGQEGSFLLWAFWTAVIGILLVWKAGKWENRVMPFYLTTLVFLFGILAWLSPYNMIHRGMGRTDFPMDLPWPPINGQGLNPSLQNYWMAIHPPTIFFGFSSLLVPFSFAVAAMIWRDYKSWASTVMPYVLLTTATLGVGLFMGGYWAYETQGWHGFWGWDPVENASLFPWLGGLGLLHGLVVQKSRGGMGRSNIFLSIVSWLLFLWGTYLTRSGVLSDFSVHAFDMLQKGALVLLIVMIAVYGLTGFGLLIWRWRSIPGRPQSDRALSRDTGMVLAISFMMMAAAAVAIATSWPLLSRFGLWQSLPVMRSLYSAKGLAAQPIFYNKFGTFILIPTLLLMGMVPFLAWGKTNAEKFLWKVLTPWLCAVGLGVLVVWFAWSQEATGFLPSTPRMVVVAVAMLGIFAALSNILVAAKLLRVKAVTMGGWLAHVGIGILFLGAVLTNVYEQTKSYALLEGDAPVKTPFGYSVQFAGWTHDGKTDAEAQKEWFEFSHGMKIRVAEVPPTGAGVAHADDGSEPAGKPAYVAITPVFKQHALQMQQGENSKKYMAWPSIHHELFRDFYIVPATDPEIIRASATLGQGETAAIRDPVHAEVRGEGDDAQILTSNVDTGYRVTYNRFFMHGGPGQAGTEMGADITVTAPDGRKAHLQPALQLTEQGMQPVAVQIPEFNAACLLKGGVDPATKRVTLEFELPEAPGKWLASVAVTNKPMILLVWLGVITMGLGTLVAMTRRAIEARKGTLLADRASQGVADETYAAFSPPAADATSHQPGAKVKAKAAKAKA